MTHIFNTEDGNKNDAYKLSIIDYFIQNGNATVNDLARFTGVSMPTASKLVSELCEAGYVNEYGKLETDEGRRPQLYGINPSSGYFLGADFNQDSVNIGLIDFTGHLVDMQLGKPYIQQNTMESLDELCSIITDFTNNIDIPREKILKLNVNISGRVNPDMGYSYSLFNFSEVALSTLIEEKTGISTTIDNDSRAMAYGEYIAGCVKGEKNVLFINISWGLGMGMIQNGKVYKGCSGFSGEIGHIHAFDNELICHCGKKGCLETEASGSAFFRIVKERISAGEASTVKTGKDGSFTFQDLIDAVNNEDSLCIDVVDSIGHKLGLQISALINIFNPELVVIGGSMAATGVYLLQAIKSAVIKYSLSLVHKDTHIVLSKLKDRAGLIGACMVARKNALHE